MGAITSGVVALVSIPGSVSSGFLQQLPESLPVCGKAGGEAHWKETVDGPSGADNMGKFFLRRCNQDTFASLLCKSIENKDFHKQKFL